MLVDCGSGNLEGCGSEYAILSFRTEYHREEKRELESPKPGFNTCPGCNHDSNFSVHSPPNQEEETGREKGARSSLDLKSELDAADQCRGHCSDGDEKSRRRFPQRWHCLRILVVVPLCRDLLLPRPLRRYYVWSYSRSHVSRPCRSRDSSAQRHFWREEASRSLPLFLLLFRLTAWWNLD